MYVKEPYYSESAVVSLYEYPNFRKRGSAFIRSVGTLYSRFFFAAVGAPVFVLSPPGSKQTLWHCSPTISIHAMEASGGAGNTKTLIWTRSRPMSKISMLPNPIVDSGSALAHFWFWKHTNFRHWTNVIRIIIILGLVFSEFP